MTKAEALYQFFAQFMTAYEENSVIGMDEPPSMPYLTYSLVIGTFDPNASGTFLPVSLWYRTSSLTAIENKINEISQAVGRSGKILTCDGGYIRLTRNDYNFGQIMGDPADNEVKRGYLSFMIEYFTNN
jgi:hypothetical protein